MVRNKRVNFFFRYRRGFQAKLAAVGLINPTAILVLCAFLTYYYEDRDGVIFVSNETLARDTGLSKRTIQRALREVREIGLIAPISGGAGHTPFTWVVTQKMKDVLL